jgi:hypothetical protein
MSPGRCETDRRPRWADVLRAGSALLLPLLITGAAHAFTITLAGAPPRTVYLQIGVGTFTGTYCGAGCTYVTPIAQSAGSAPGTNTTINKVSVAVAANAVGNGVAQAMTTDSTQSQSFFDGFAFCNTPAQLYIGGFYRTPGNSGAGTTATVTATVPVSLTDAAGDSLAFTQISWTSGGNADSGAEPFPAGSFTGTSQVVGSIANNQWAESCWTFSYKNTVVPAAGTYTGRVLYTLSAP